MMQNPVCHSMFFGFSVYVCFDIASAPSTT